MIDCDHQGYAVARALIECGMRVLGFEEHRLSRLEREAFLARIEGKLALNYEENLRPFVMMVQLAAAAGRRGRDLDREIAAGERHDIGDFEPAEMGCRGEGFRVLISPDLHGTAPIEKCKPCKG